MNLTGSEIKVWVGWFDRIRSLPCQCSYTGLRLWAIALGHFSPGNSFVLAFVCELSV